MKSPTAKFTQQSGSALYLPEGVLPRPSPGMRQVFSDGKLVGEVPMTGDDRKDAAAAKALLESKGHKSPTKLQTMLYVARSFAMTATDLRERHLSTSPSNGYAAVPFIVNAAFSMEVYLKLLHASLNKRKR